MSATKMDMVPLKTPSSRQLADPDSRTIWATASSTLLRLVGYLSMVYPYAVPWPIQAMIPPLSYLVYLSIWLGFDQRRYGREVVEVREIVKVVDGGRGKMRRVDGVEKEIHVRRQGEVGHTGRGELTTDPNASERSAGTAERITNRNRHPDIEPIHECDVPGDQHAHHIGDHR